MTALQFINFIAASELPVAEAAADFKQYAVPPMDEIIECADHMRLTKAVSRYSSKYSRLTEIIEWAKESQS